MRLLFTLIVLAAACYGLFLLSGSQPHVTTKIHEMLNTGSFNTLELRYSAAQIMDAQRKKLLKDSRHRFLEPSIKFYPYLLMEIKYAASSRKTKEGMILWDMTDGEMVLSTKDWEKTHGFSDCIEASVDKQEFRVISTLASKGGVADRDALSKTLHVENEVLDAWVEGCRNKRLIVQTGNRYRLHLEKPLFQLVPLTKIDQRLVTKAHQNTDRVPQRFSTSQVEKMAKIAFGSDFAVRKTALLYLPVHCITVQNPDGSVHTSYWNALNGKPLSSHFVD
ncbi:MAG: hypothetical protein RLZZ453_583 [Chlamydiota bacterium]|jgi:hypothetical protein